MQHPDMRISTLNHFTIELQHKTQNAVRSRVLRPKVKGVVLYFSHNANCLVHASVIVFTDDARCDFAWLNRDRLIDHALLLGVITHLDMARNREILAKRMADKTVVGQNATQIGMAFEHDTKQIESFALKPVGRAPELAQRR